MMDLEILIKIFISLTKISIIFIIIYKIILFNTDKDKLLLGSKVNKNIFRFKYITDLNNLIIKLSENKNNTNILFKFLNPLLIIIFSIIFSILIYFISNQIFKIKSTAFIISVFCFFLPYFLFKMLVHKKKHKILKIFPGYILDLKKYVKTDNNIVLAFKYTKVVSPLTEYIEKFNISIDRGLNIYDAFENLKVDINIKKISEIITIIQKCYLYGGDFEKLLDRYSKILMNKNIQKEKEKQNTYTSKLILTILVNINIYMLYSFIYKNEKYLKIMTTTIPGIIIININILSYILIIFLIFKINKMED